MRKHVHELKASVAMAPIYFKNSESLLHIGKAMFKHPHK